MSLPQIDIGPVYFEEQEGILLDKIALRKKELADQLLILCHHYQQEAVYSFADMTGDSLKLAKYAANAGDSIPDPAPDRKTDQ